MKHVSMIVAALVLATATNAALARGKTEGGAPVALLTPVTFAPTTDPRAEVRDECKMGEQLATHIGDSLRHVNNGPGTTESTQGDVLKVTVTTIWGARGNNWTGPKGLTLDAVIMHDGVVLRSTSMHRTTMGGFWGAFKGICSFMDRNATAIGKDLATWTTDAKFTPPSEGTVPVEAASEAGVRRGALIDVARARHAEDEFRSRRGAGAGPVRRCAAFVGNAIVDADDRTRPAADRHDGRPAAGARERAQGHHLRRNHAALDGRGRPAGRAHAAGQQRRAPGRGRRGLRREKLRDPLQEQRRDGLLGSRRQAGHPSQVQPVGSTT